MPVTAASPNSTGFWRGLIGGDAGKEVISGMAFTIHHYNVTGAARASRVGP
jgi:hypothetical protein